jgi:hypothetical protein
MLSHGILVFSLVVRDIVREPLDVSEVLVVWGGRVGGGVGFKARERVCMCRNPCA